MRGQSRSAYTFGTTCPRIDASAMPAAIQTISSSTTSQGVRFQVERNTAPRRPSLGPWSTVGEEPYVVADVPGSRRVPRRQRCFGGSILGGSDQADSRLSFVVPLLELILGDLA
jgi:hypothetical protein